MPLVDIKVIQGVFTAEEKHELVKRVSETVIALEGEALRPLTHVGITETANGEWAIDGQYLHRRGRQGTSSRHMPDANRYSHDDTIDYDMDPPSHELASKPHVPSAPPLPARAPRA